MSKIAKDCIYVSFVKYSGIYLLLFALSAPLSNASELSTPDIVKTVADKDCLDYGVRGVCLWLNCSPLGCQVRSSIYIEHYLPDAVVMVYSENPPWPAARALHKNLRSTLKLGGGGWGTGKHGARYYDASVVGSPALSVVQYSHQALALCPSAAKAMEPYFASELDSLRWRFFLGTEHASLLNPRTVGTGANVWGPLMPRNGFIIQAHATKAASVVAQRAADIVSRTGQKHVYRPLPSDCGQGCTGPPAIEENSARGGKWQRLHPSRASCEVFGAKDRSAEYGDGHESYAWHLWRPYRCCKPMGQVLLKIIETESG